MRRGEVIAVVVGADRIMHNGDVANKIGNGGLGVHRAGAPGAMLRRQVPWSTVDLATPDGAAIPIEERSRDEVVRVEVLLACSCRRARAPGTRRST